MTAWKELGIESWKAECITRRDLGANSLPYSGLVFAFFKSLRHGVDIGKFTKVKQVTQAVQEILRNF